MNNKNRDWYKSELEAAGIYGKKVSMSGAGRDKLDVTGEEEYSQFKFDNKFTEKKSFSIKRDEWESMIRQAHQHGKEFIGRIVIQDKLKLIVMEERVFRNNFEEDK